MSRKIAMKKDIKNDMDRTDKKIGIYAITGASLLVYIFWLFLEDANVLAYVTLIVNLVWYIYSKRLLCIYTESDYTKSYTINYLLCALMCWIIYIIDIPMLYRNIGIFFISSEGFARTFFVEIRKLIKKSD